VERRISALTSYAAPVFEEILPPLLNPGLWMTDEEGVAGLS